MAAFSESGLGKILRPSLTFADIFSPLSHATLNTYTLLQYWLYNGCSLP